MTTDENIKIQLQTVNKPIDDSNSGSDHLPAKLASKSSAHLNSTTKTTSSKWSCSSCTYQNWPKSQHCVMCHVQRVSTNTNSTHNNQNSNTSAVTTNARTTTIANAPSIKIKEPSKKVQVNSSSSYNLLKTLQIQLDRLFLSACEGVVDGDMTQLHRYVTAGGDLTRYLTSDEVQLLNRPATFTVGLTLLHLCYQFNRKDFLVKILNNQASSVQQGHKKQLHDHKQTTGTSRKNLVNALLKHVNNTKFSPCQSCPSLAVNIVEGYFSASLRQRKTNSRSNNSNNNLDLSGATATNAALLCHQNSPTTSLISLSTGGRNMSPSPSPPPFTLGATSINSFLSQCFYVNECHTFLLPSEIDDFSARIQHILFDELLDRQVQQELENESRAINWNVDLIKRHNSRLYPLWNRATVYWTVSSRPAMACSTLTTS